MSERFTLAFYNKESAKEYANLDGSQRVLVGVALKKLAQRADQLGTPLEKELAGCRKLKWRKAGLRMVYRIVDETTVEIVEIIAIGRRDKERVYRHRLAVDWRFRLSTSDYAEDRGSVEIPAS